MANEFQKLHRSGPGYLIIAFVAGALGFAVLDRLARSLTVPDQPTTIAEHWRLVEAHRDFLKNPDNFKPVPQTPGLLSATPPTRNELSLAALVAARELIHVDLVFPNVPKNRETNRIWMDWVETQEDVFEASGNPQYADYEVSGEPPLHLQLWFRPRAKAEVQKLIAAIEAYADVSHE